MANPINGPTPTFPAEGAGRRVARATAATAVALLQIVTFAIWVAIDVAARIILRICRREDRRQTKTEKFLLSAIYVAEWALRSLIPAWRNLAKPICGEIIDISKIDPAVAAAFDGNFTGVLYEAARTLDDAIENGIKLSGTVDGCMQPQVAVRVTNFIANATNNQPFKGLGEAMAAISGGKKRSDPTDIAFITILIGNEDRTQDLGGGVPPYVQRCAAAVKKAIDELRGTGKTPIFVGTGRGATAAQAYAQEYGAYSLSFEPSGIGDGVAKKAHAGKNGTNQAQHISISVRNPPGRQLGRTYVDASGKFRELMEDYNEGFVGMVERFYATIHLFRDS